DLKEKLGKDFDRELESKFRKYGSAAEASADARDARQKAGRSPFLDDFGSGSEHQLDGVANRLHKELVEAHRRFQELPLEKQQEIEKQLTEALKNFKESKSAAAEYTVDAIVAAVAIGGAAFTGGGSLGLLALTTAAAGAIGNVALKAAILGK